MSKVDSSQIKGIANEIKSILDAFEKCVTDNISCCDNISTKATTLAGYDGKKVAGSDSIIENTDLNYVIHKWKKWKIKGVTQISSTCASLKAKLQEFENIYSDLLASELLDIEASADAIDGYIKNVQDELSGIYIKSNHMVSTFSKIMLSSDKFSKIAYNEDDVLNGKYILSDKILKDLWCEKNLSFKSCGNGVYVVEKDGVTMGYVSAMTAVKYLSNLKSLSNITQLENDTIGKETKDEEEELPIEVQSSLGVSGAAILMKPLFSNDLRISMDKVSKLSNGNFLLRLPTGKVVINQNGKVILGHDVLGIKQSYDKSTGILTQTYKSGMKHYSGENNSYGIKEVSGKFTGSSEMMNALGIKNYKDRDLIIQESSEGKYIETMKGESVYRDKNGKYTGNLEAFGIKNYRDRDLIIQESSEGKYIENMKGESVFQDKNGKYTGDLGAFGISEDSETYSDLLIQERDDGSKYVEHSDGRKAIINVDGTVTGDTEIVVIENEDSSTTIIREYYDGRKEIVCNDGRSAVMDINGKVSGDAELFGAEDLKWDPHTRTYSQKRSDGSIYIEDTNGKIAIKYADGKIIGDSELFGDGTKLSGYRVTSYHPGDYCQSGTVTGSGKSINDFDIQVIEGKRVYTYNGKIVVATATEELMREFNRKGYTKNGGNIRQEGKHYFNYYDELTVTINGKNYDAIVLDSCGAAMWEGEYRIDLFVPSSSDVISANDVAISNFKD